MLKYIILLLSILISLSSCSDEPTAPDVTPPDAVSNFTVDKAGEMIIELSWDKNKEKDMDGYILKRLKDNETIFSFRDSVFTNSYIDTVDSYTSSYSYEIYAFDKSRNISLVNDDVRQVTAGNSMAPKDPDSITVFAINRGLNRSVNVNWNSTDIDIKQFNLIRESVSAIASKIPITYFDTLMVNGKLRTFADTSVTFDTKYTYSIQAIDLGNKSSRMVPGGNDIVLNKPQLIAPNIKADGTDTTVTSAKINLTWNSVVGVNHYELILSQDKELLNVDITPSGSSVETYSVDLSKIEGLQSGVLIEWNVLTYSKENSEINSSSDKKASFIYTK